MKIRGFNLTYPKGLGTDQRELEQKKKPTMPKRPTLTKPTRPKCQQMSCRLGPALGPSAQVDVSRPFVGVDTSRPFSRADLSQPSTQTHLSQPSA